MAKRTAPETTEPAAEWVDVAKLTPWVKNPKPIEARDVREMSRSIRRFGFGAPIVARRANGEIIEGHLRYAAATRLKLTRVPVRFLDLSEDEAHMLAIAAIKFEHRRMTDDEQLAQILDELEERGVDLERGTGFDAEELDELLEQLSGPAACTAKKGGKELLVNEVDVSALAAAKFSLMVHGPMAAQPDVLDRLRAALVGVDGVSVDVMTS